MTMEIPCVFARGAFVRLIIEGMIEAADGFLLEEITDLFGCDCLLQSRSHFRGYHCPSESPPPTKNNRTEMEEGSVETGPDIFTCLEFGGTMA